jgi:protein O-GlcNAc transferase
MTATERQFDSAWRSSHEKGRTAFGQGAYTDAANAFLHALELNPSAAEVHHDLAVVWHLMGRYEQALTSFNKAVALNSELAQAWFNGGNTLCAMKREREAIDWFSRAVALKPNYVTAHYNLAKAYKTMGKHSKAYYHYQSALVIDPTMAEAHNNMGSLLLASGSLDQALTCFKQALNLKADYAEAIYNYALTLNRLGRPGEAVAHAQSCIQLQPDNGEALALLVSLLQQTCDWHQLCQAEKQLDRLTRQQLENDLRTSESPFLNFARCTNARHNLMISRSWSRYLTSNHPLHRPRFTFTKDLNSGKRLNIGYLSERFRNAATGHLTAGIFARHDRERFNVFAYSWGQDDGSYYRRKIESGVDHFIDIRNMSDFDAAVRINDDGIDILVDMMGWMHGNRMAILAQRPAPIQVNYLGYPGTSGAGFMDYLVADQVVIPPEQRQYYSEQVIWMPHCYQANDPQTPIDMRVHTHLEYGLPENGIVFCAFNTDYKIEPAAFKAWMRILHRVPNSVLWLLVRSPEARRNLKRAAEAQGINSQRLIFASPLAKDAHMARLRLADLALDTFTVNGHTTASDALKAGVPVITCLGNHFASRAAASILHAVGLGQLVTRSVSDYEDLAVSLALNRAQRIEIVNRLEHNKKTHPLFDIERYVRNLEAAFRQMWQQYVGDVDQEKSA